MLPNVKYNNDSQATDFLCSSFTGGRNITFRIDDQQNMSILFTYLCTDSNSKCVCNIVNWFIKYSDDNSHSMIPINNSFSPKVGISLAL